MTNTDPVEKLRKDAGLEHRPTPLTYEMRLAMSGEGEWAFQWTDKPHRLIYTLCTALENAEVKLAMAQDALTNAEQQIEQLRHALKVLLKEATGFSVSGVYFDEECMGHKGPDLARAALSRS